MISKVVVFLSILVTVALSIDYCEDYLCEGRKHIGCKNDGKFGKSCPPNAELIKFTDKLKTLALSTHNNYRNQIALGEIKGYDKAARMATLVWHDELAKLAEYNVRTCTFGHDECRNTDKFPYAGQNLGILIKKKTFPTPEEMIKKITKGWFDEYADADKNIMKSYQPNGKMIGHFTQLVRDQAFAVGCAMIKFKSGEYSTIYGCDYSLTSIKSYPIYDTSSKPASNCTKGAHKQFKGLCSINEIYDNNDLFYSYD
ncbi:antigen 5 like allergen Cul n 1-like [Contarinia nasturtii]|uniref:antigen 5 like allergen Cul n 1-like n=1 Tax=Contarinia nasturtii TaxID=265458 RepID=UPI0012D4759D|nr:antigen 5 like allergen Cul n 1-like [Contarinia nasturtii]